MQLNVLQQCNSALNLQESMFFLPKKDSTGETNQSTVEMKVLRIFYSQSKSQTAAPIISQVNREYKEDCQAILQVLRAHLLEIGASEPRRILTEIDHK